MITFLYVLGTVTQYLYSEKKILLGRFPIYGASSVDIGTFTPTIAAWIDAGDFSFKVNTFFHPISFENTVSKDVQMWSKAREREKVCLC